MVPPEIAASRYVSLATHRRDGRAVPTPVWAVGDGDELLVWTRADSGKAKRLRNDPRVTVVPCDVRGATAEGAVPVQANARLTQGREQLDRVRRAMAGKYGWQFRLVDGGGALLHRGGRRHVGVVVTF